MTTPPRTPTWVEPDGTPSEPGEHPHYAIWDHEGRKWDTSDKLTARIAAHPAHPAPVNRWFDRTDGVNHHPQCAVMHDPAWSPCEVLSSSQSSADPAPLDVERLRKAVRRAGYGIPLIADTGVDAIAREYAKDPQP